MTQSLQSLLGLDLLQRLIARACSRGADFAEIFVERSRTHALQLEQGAIRGAALHSTLGVGIRAIAGGETGYAHSDDLSPDALLEAADVAAAIARARHGAGPTLEALRAIDVPSRYRVQPLPHEVAPADKTALLLRADAAARRVDGRITQVMGALVDTTREILVATSCGILAEDTQAMCRMHISAVATSRTGEQRIGFDGGGGRVGMQHYEATHTPEQMAQEATRMALAQLGAIEAPAGPQTVVLSPGWSGILLHEAVGHGLEADFIHKGTSLYSNRLGEQVASPLCTVIDSGTVPHGRGSLNVDDEGHVPQQNVLIENGTLRGYLTDRLSAKGTGYARTGSGRRQSFRHAPMPRMTNTYLAAGAHEHDEIVSSVRSGLYCAAFGGGQVDITNGNFVFEVREGYMIEDGKLTQPVKGATLIGVGPEALRKVSMVGNNPKLDPGIGTCGKDGQTLPVGVGMPTVRLDGITVGGTRAS